MCAVVELNAENTFWGDAMERWRISYGIVFFLFLVLVSACEQKQEPIKIGFVAGLTGRHSNLATDGRDGVILAVEEVNRAGGIDGRPVELLTRDNRLDTGVAAIVHQELIDEGVIAIVGHMTSTMSIAALPVSNANKVLMMSPTSSTNSLSGIDDYLFRVMSSSEDAITRLSEYLYTDKELRQVVVVYDTSNAKFSEEWLLGIQDYYQKIGQGKVVPVPFISSNELSFAKLAAEVLEQAPDGVVLVAAANDAARICQQLKKQGGRMPLFATMWSMTAEFLRNGGGAVEGVVFCHWFIETYPSFTSKEFRSAFEKRFGYPANFASHFSYEASQVIFAALKKDPDPDHLRETITGIKVFQGTQGDIVINAYGDAQRRIFLLTVKDGRFYPLGDGVE